ncbi:MAG: hypothetical protein HRU28_09690 [Rhizobiales bacterium]|nr:hypothetical protein [Hyphomicrobiales bacterium]
MRILLVTIGVLLSFTSSFLGFISMASAQNGLISDWQLSEFSGARAHILQADAQKISIAIEINISKNYKTYWKSSGSTGIAPIVVITGTNVNADVITLNFPHPGKFINKYGETWGYKDRTILFVETSRKAEDKQTKLELQLHYAVCDVICLPVSAQFNLGLNGGKLAKTSSYIEFYGYSSKIPKHIPQAETIIKSASIDKNNILTLNISEALTNDVFITDVKKRFYQVRSTNPKQLKYNILGVTIDDDYKNNPLNIQYAQSGKSYKLEIMVD